MSVIYGALTLIVAAVVGSIPGWVSAAIWGWHWFAAGVVIFWLGSASAALLLTLLAAIGDPDDMG